MIWIAVLASLVALLVLAILVRWLILYLRFSQSDERRWAGQVLGLLGEAEQCARSGERELGRLKASRDAEARRVREEAFATYLGDVPVEDLDAYPGIGPGTVSKLRAAGYVNLAALLRADIQVHGLGKKRLTDINRAVRGLLGKARSTFDAGAGPQAEILADRLTALSARYDGQEVRTHARVRAAEAFLDCLGEMTEAAQGVTFWRWLRARSPAALVPAQLMAAPLPDLQATLRAAEDFAMHRGSEKRDFAPADPAPAIPTSAEPPASPPYPLPEPAKGPTRDECLALLEIPSDVPLSADLVRRQWHLLTERLDPDRAAALGLEFVKLALDKRAALRRAAEVLLEALGEKLETPPPAPPAPELRHNPDLDDVFGGP